MKNKNTIDARGTYGKATEWMRKKRVYTRQEIITYLNEECGKSLDRGAATISPAEATATILLTPRLSSDRGDIRGNVNNPWGHLAYNENLPRKINGMTGKKEPQRFRFRFRDDALEPLRRKEMNARSLKLDHGKTAVADHAAQVEVTSSIDGNGGDGNGTAKTEELPERTGVTCTTSLAEADEPAKGPAAETSPAVPEDVNL
jgi:hypothetical protein